MSIITWLHLSDLHFRSEKRDTWDRDVVLTRLIDDVGEQIRKGRLRLDFIIVSGDIAYKGKTKDYRLAEQFFNKLLKVTHIHKRRLFVVPGNHDVDLRATSPGAKGIISSLTTREAINDILDSKDRRLIFNRLVGYRQFIGRYFGPHFVFDHNNYYYVKLFKNSRKDGCNVAVIGLNSAWLAYGSKRDRDRIAVGERQVSSALKQVKGVDLCIAILHHPFDWLRHFEKKYCEAELFENCHFILHGHLHEGGVQTLKNPDAEAMIIAGGSCYKTRKYHNSYNLVKLHMKTGEGTVYFQTYSDAGRGFWTKDNEIYKNVEGEFSFSMPSLKTTTVQKAKGKYLQTVGKKADLDLAPETRHILNEFLEEEIKDIHSIPTSGCFRLSVGEVVGSDGLFIHPPWVNYVSGKGSGELLDNLKTALIQKRKVLLLGEPGGGKTTLLKRLFTILANDFLNGTSDALGIYIPLRDFAFFPAKTEGTLKWLFTYLSKKPKNPLQLSFETFHSFVNNGAIVLLLDGFDEMEGRISQKSINQRASKPLFSYVSVLSCRANFFKLYLSESAMCKQYSEIMELMPLEFDSSVKSFVLSFCRKKGEMAPQKAENVVDLIKGNEDLLDLAERFLCLVMILDIFTDPVKMMGNGIFANAEDMSKANWNQARLFQLFTDKWLSIEADKPDSLLKWESKRKIMEEIAWFIYQQGSPSKRAYKDILYQNIGFNRDKIAKSLRPYSRTLNLSLEDLADDICLRCFLLGTHRGNYYFIHKSFLEYYISRYILGCMIESSGKTVEVIRELIPVEIASFLKDALLSEDFKPSLKEQIVNNLIESYESNKGNESTSVKARQHSSYYLAVLGTDRAEQFLGEVVEKETDRWVQRGIMVGLADFCGRSDMLERYFKMLQEDEVHEEVILINTGYHLVYYGDQALEEGYYDKGGKKCSGTLRAILRHLKREKNSKIWPLDLFTLRTLLQTRGEEILKEDIQYAKIIRKFLSVEHKEQGDLFQRQRELLKKELLGDGGYDE